MNTQKLMEIDRLVSEMYDDGLDGDEMRHLEDLLAGDSIAQKHYWEFVDTHVALSAAVSSNSLPTGSLPLQPENASPAGMTSLKGRRPFVFFQNAWWLAGAAAVLLVGYIGAMNWRSSVISPDLGRRPIASQSPFYAIESMPSITQVSWEGPSFGQNVSDWKPASIVSAGAISLRVEEGELADGYLFCLMPGESVKLLATFDATGENSLSVVEILDDQRTTLKKVSFHNSGSGPKPLHANPAARNRRYGILGHWSEINTTELPRYFLLTGVHKLANPEPDASWKVSKIAVLVESEQVVHLGWDDSGPAPAEGDAYREDYDYDDLAASLFFNRRSETPNSERAGIQVVANQQLPMPMVPSTLDGGYDFELAPHEMAIVKAASEARYFNAVVAIDMETQEILWSSPNQLEKSTNLGAACLMNPTANARKIRLIGIHKPHNSKGPGIPWRTSTFETLYEQPGFFIIGFDDSVGDRDFNDVRVSILTTSVPEPYGL